MRSFIICPLHDKIKEDEKDGECRTHGEDKKCVHVIGRSRSKETVRRPKHRWGSGVKTGCEVVEVIYMTQSRGR
jgi:hypothetical protein